MESFDRDDSLSLQRDYQHLRSRASSLELPKIQLPLPFQSARFSRLTPQSTLSFVAYFIAFIMKTSTFVAISLFSLSSTVLAAPTPQLKNILGSITNPSAGNNNVFEGNGNNNGNGNGNRQVVKDTLVCEFY